jgi:hypothetical protein
MLDLSTLRIASRLQKKLRIGADSGFMAISAMKAAVRVLEHVKMRQPRMHRYAAGGDRRLSDARALQKHPLEAAIAYHSKVNFKS